MLTPTCLKYKTVTGARIHYAHSHLLALNSLVLCESFSLKYESRKVKSALRAPNPFIYTRTVGEAFSEIQTFGIHAQLLEEEIVKR